MIRRILLPLLLAVAPPALAQAAEAEIYLAPIERIGDSIIVRAPVNVTRRAGYDNQPSFTADSRAVLYTAQANGQTNIWRYDIVARRTRQLTSTPESEYSATQIPGESRFSVVRVERDSTQRLWSFDMEGGDPRLVLRDLKPVGYHAWLDRQRLAAFVLGTPSTLHLIARDGSRDTVIARDVGRALQRLPEGANSLFTFTQRTAPNRLGIFVFTGRTRTAQYARKTVSIPPGGRVTGTSRSTLMVDSSVVTYEPPYELVAASPDNEYHAWTPDVILTTTLNSVLMRWNSTLGAGSGWLPVADLKRFGVKNVSRLTFSNDGQWLAFVAEPVRP